MLIRDVQVGRRGTDVRLVGGWIAAMGSGLPVEPGEDVLDGRGGALIPGLHDHHVHALALAAALESVRLGPPAVADEAAFARALAHADSALSTGRWLRGVDYQESVAGPLDRWRLDALVPGRPVRIQHRGGALWTLNSVAVRAVGLDHGRIPGADYDGSGQPTGRLLQVEDGLRHRLPDAVPDLARVGALLARYGVTGFTDVTPYRRLDDLTTLATAVHSGEMVQRVVATGGPDLVGAEFPAPLGVGPVKIVVGEPDQPSLDQLVDWYRAAHKADRTVAVHCVTRDALALALMAWDVAGSRRGDRVEHAAVVPPALGRRLKRHGLTVVTQPGFIAEQGDRYRVDLAPVDLDHLYPCRNLLRLGVLVAFSTDAPYGDPDPWAALRAAAARRTADGVPLGEREAIPPARALELFLGPLEQPGGPPRGVAVGQPADLVLLDAAMDRVFADPHPGRVVATLRAGRLVYQRQPE